MNVEPPVAPDGDRRSQGPSAERVEAFVRLLGQNQRRLFLYLMSLAPDYNDAEEIMQETNLVLWREFDQFQLGTNFAAWACKVAFHQVLAWRKRKQRDRLEFSPAFLETVAEEASSRLDELESRTQALARCMEQLPAAQRQLLHLRYTEASSIEAMAGQLNRTVDAVYRALSRIRQALHECVTRALLQENRP